MGGAYRRAQVCYASRMWAWEHIVREWRVIKGAPLSVVTLMIASLVAGWIFASYYYRERIAVLEDRLSYGQEQRDNLVRENDQLRRVLSPEEARQFEESLSSSPGDVTLHIGESEESRIIGEQMKTLFEDAGWNVLLATEHDIDGVEIAGEGEQEQEAIKRALQELPSSNFMQLPHDGSEPEFAPLR